MFKKKSDKEATEQANKAQQVGAGAKSEQQTDPNVPKKSFTEEFGELYDFAFDRGLTLSEMRTARTETELLIISALQGFQKKTGLIPQELKFRVATRFPEEWRSDKGAPKPMLNYEIAIIATLP